VVGLGVLDPTEKLRIGMWIDETLAEKRPPVEKMEALTLKTLELGGCKVVKGLIRNHVTNSGIQRRNCALVRVKGQMYPCRSVRAVGHKKPGKATLMSFEVIDGQQRLATFTLLLAADRREGWRRETQPSRQSV
jgi:hypothetical protein